MLQFPHKFTRNKLRSSNGENKTILSREKMDVYWLRYVGVNIFTFILVKNECLEIKSSLIVKQKCEDKLIC